MSRSSQRAWTREELAIVRSRYYVDPIEALMQRLNRTESSIRSMARRMGVATEDTTPYNDPTIKICLNCKLPTCRPNMCKVISNYYAKENKK